MRARTLVVSPSSRCASHRGAPRTLWPALLILPLLPGLVAACAPEKQKELKAGQKAIILTGTLAPIEKVEVTAAVSAIVKQILVETGNRVARGQVVVRLDESTLAADVKRAEAALSLARANLAQAESTSYEAQLAEARAEVQRLQHELERERRLAAQPASTSDYQEASIVLANARAKLDRLYSLLARRLASKPEVEAAENEWAEAQRRFEAATEAFERRTAGDGSGAKIAEARYDAARARLRGLEMASRRGTTAQARAQVREAEANLAQARYNRALTAVEAPIGGIVTDIKAQPAEKVYERSPLLTIQEIGRVRVEADLSPGLLPHVRVGQSAQVTVNTVPPTTVASTIASILPVADPKTQSLGVALILPNPDLKFQPGFTARVEIAIEGGAVPAAPAAKPAGR